MEEEEEEEGEEEEEEKEVRGSVCLHSFPYFSKKKSFFKLDCFFLCTLSDWPRNIFLKKS